jgi:hypothetical protein
MSGEDTNDTRIPAWIGEDTNDTRIPAWIEIVPSDTPIQTLHESQKQRRVQEACKHEFKPGRRLTLDRKTLQWCELCGALSTHRPQSLR